MSTLTATWTQPAGVVRVEGTDVDFDVEPGRGRERMAQVRAGLAKHGLERTKATAEKAGAGVLTFQVTQIGTPSEPKVQEQEDKVSVDTAEPEVQETEATAGGSEPTALADMILDGSDLLRQLRNVQPFTDRDKTLPVLLGVAVTIKNGVLGLIATDRFRLVVAAVRQNGEDAPKVRDLVEHQRGGEIVGFITNDQVKAMLAVLRSLNPNMVRVEVTDAGGLLFKDAVMDTPLGSADAPNSHGEFPKYAQLIDLDRGYNPKSFDGVVGLNPKYLADICKVQTASRNQAMRISVVSATSPVIVTWDNDTSIVALQMPVKPAS